MSRIMNPSRLELARNRSRTPTFQPAYSRVRNEAEAFLSSNASLAPPEETAGFYHDYFCPDHAQQLCFNPADPHRHCCPEDGREFVGEPYDAAWRWFVNNKLSTTAFQLALLWSLDNDEACRSRCHDILRGYAKRYSHYEGSRPEIGKTRNGRRGGGGKATFQSLDEAVWLIPLVRAYDLLRESLGTDARALIESELLRPAAEHLLRERFLEIHNIECWHNAAIAAVGICLDETAWQDEALKSEFGFWQQLRGGVDDDGWWWEGSSSYHFYALTALVSLAQLWEYADDSLPAKEPRLARMFSVAVELMQPDGRLPATNDCWFSTSLLGEVCHGVPTAAALYEVAHAWFDDRRFVWILQQNYASPSNRDSVETLLYGANLPAADTEFTPTGCLLPAAGISQLRSSDPLATQTSIFLKHGPHGGGHGHPDKLAISFYLGGHPTSPDLGTPGYGIPLNDSWFRQTISHNTVIVDGYSQPPAHGSRAEGSNPLAGTVDAWVEWQQQPYDGISMRRTVLQCAGEYFVDFFTVEATRQRRFDWACRVDGDLLDTPGFVPDEPVTMDGDGYGHVDAASFFLTESPADDLSPRLDWQLLQGHLSLFLPFEGGTTLVQGRVPYNPTSRTSDIVLRRRTARSTTYVAVFHGWHSECRIDRVSPVVGAMPENPLAFWVHMADGERHLVALSTKQQVTLPGEAEADRVFSYARSPVRTDGKS